MVKLFGLLPDTAGIPFITGREGTTGF